MPLTFPAHLFNPSSVKLSDAGRAILSPGTISGVVQAMRTDGGGLVKIDYAGINLRNADLLRAWEAWRVELGGGAALVNVPALSLARAPRPLQGGRLARVGALHAGNDLDPYFPEVVGYGAPIIVATINPAILRATSVTINVAQGSRIVGGQVFEVTHPTFGKRIYQTGRVLGRTDQSTTVSIWPPLRETIPATAHVNFDWPCLTCRLVPDSDISPDISFGGASVSISFVEAF